MAHLNTIEQSLIADALTLAAIERSNWGAISAAITGPRAEGDDGETAKLVSPEDFEARNAEIDVRIVEINEQNAGRRMSPEHAQEWNDLNAERDENEQTLAEVRARIETIAARAAGSDAASRAVVERGASFNVRKPGVARGEDVFDLSTVAQSYSDPTRGASELRERASRVLDEVKFTNGEVDESRSKEFVEGLLSIPDGDPDSFASSDLAKRMLLTESPAYKRAFANMLGDRPNSTSEHNAYVAARTLTIGSTANYPVPVTLDPTMLKIGSGSVNPLRAISKVATITGNTWKGVNAAAVSASYGAESSVATDNTPTLTQPTLNVELAKAFVPFSIEAGQDWGSIESDIASLFADSKDDLEAVKFFLGAGHGSQEPSGLITGATTTVTAGGTAAFAVADVYKTEEALPDKYLERAQWVSTKFIYNKVRQFDTAGGASLWIETLREGMGNAPSGNTGYDLIGYAANKSSAMTGALTTGTKIAVLGDFRYFQIVDRVGMDIELVPHLMDPTTGYPLGQRGLLAHWRNTAGVLYAGAFRTLVTG